MEQKADLKEHLVAQSPRHAASVDVPLKRARTVDQSDLAVSGGKLNCAAIVGCILFGLLCCWNYGSHRLRGGDCASAPNGKLLNSTNFSHHCHVWSGRALLLDQGPGLGPACATVFVWCIAAPMGLWKAKVCAGGSKLREMIEHDTAVVVSNKNASFPLNDKIERLSCSRRDFHEYWACAMQLGIWPLLFFEFLIFWLDVQTPTHWLLFVPMIFMVIFVFSFFRYLAQVNFMVQRAMTAKVNMFAEEMSNAGKGNVNFWHEALIEYHQHVEDCKQLMTWTKYGGYFHGAVIATVIWFCPACLNFWLQVNKLKKGMMGGVDQKTVSTVGLLLLNGIYFSCGAYFCIETLLNMALMNSTSTLKKAAEEYLKKSGKGMTLEERQEWRGYVLMVQSLSGSSPICTFMFIPVTRSKVLGSLVRFGVVIPSIVFFMARLWKVGLSQVIMPHDHNSPTTSVAL